MNIWYFSHYAGGPGIGRLSRAYHLGREWDKFGHSTTVFVAQFHHHLDNLENLPPEKSVDGVQYIALPARRYGNNGIKRILNIFDFCWSMLTLAWNIKSNVKKPHVIIVTSPHPFAIYPAFILSRRYRAKLIFEVRDIWPLSVVEINGTRKWHPFVLLSGLAERFAYRNSRLVASLLGASEEHMLRHGLKPGKFVHVPNGVDLEKPVALVPPTSEPAKAVIAKIREWRSERRLIIIHPGSQGVPNALDRLLDATTYLNQQKIADRFGILLLGDGNMTEQLKLQSARLKLKNVAFFPSVTKSEALWLTNLCDVGYAGARNYRNVYRYGISFNKIMDFMESGLPIILPIFAQGDPVSESGCGIVTGSDEPQDIARALTRILNIGDEARLAMGLKGKEYVRQAFNYSEIASRYIRAIEVS